MTTLLLTGCDSSNNVESSPLLENNGASVGVENTQERSLATIQEIAEVNISYLETGDLSSLKQQGKLRILVPQWEGDTHLPRQGLPANTYRRMAQDFANEIGLEAIWVPTVGYDQLIPDLLAGKGDLIATNMTQTKSRSEKIDFAHPLNQVYEQLVTTDPNIKTLNNLSTITVSVRNNTAFHDTAIDKQKEFSGMKIKSLPQNLSYDQIIDQLNSGEIQATIMDSNITSTLETYRQDFRVAFNISDTRNIAWGVRPNSPDLLKALNNFVLKESLTSHRQEHDKLSWEDIKKKKTLRLITRNSQATYFMLRGELLGFEYDLVKKFADMNKLHLEVVVPPPEVDPLDWLKQGRGDLVAASLTVTPERKARGFEFTRFYNRVTEQLVGKKNDLNISTLEDLKGRSIHVRKNTSYWSTLKSLQAQGADFNLIAADPEMTTSELVGQVASGEIDLTVLDSHLLAIETTYRDDIKSLYNLGEPNDLGWALRKDQPKLLQALNKFLKKEYRGLYFNITYNKYFKNKKKILKHSQKRLTASSELSPYDALTEPFASKHHFDWRLITSQMYQESRFNPKAISFAGALGLMQVMPKTADEFGYKNLSTPKTGIEAGITYLDWVRDRFAETLPVEERMRFTLASYNAGYGHVRDARRLAKKMGKNPDVWFGNVEQAMLLLAKPMYAKQARYGYCRGQEPVNYVRQIQDRYQGYLAVQ